jgi:hypothetical protein
MIKNFVIIILFCNCFSSSCSSGSQLQNPLSYFRYYIGIEDKIPDICRIEDLQLLSKLTEQPRKPHESAFIEIGAFEGHFTMARYDFSGIIFRDVNEIDKSKCWKDIECSLQFYANGLLKSQICKGFDSLGTTIFYTEFICKNELENMPCQTISYNQHGDIIGRELSRARPNCPAPSRETAQ